ncbi:uncharacterized protein MICPUCDRAFT_66923 [Micromonas pusilla CCMP1545]|uniref:Predicted protein n=1 Tax=Micromonas pusilla (strain CCMP1545) TaxID=564608 RepID=C1N544_MICPC|nr:uncharacterized protein MICPUCDRAFT_66923 [Micromonas pusilla CCMP1545]EEH52848.1 predicted protein [Micromonas pusilla CCMP1545]|eukprot:XP_003062909.1 predicted protein [Micromonas pusilla CCMP1545]
MYYQSAVLPEVYTVRTVISHRPSSQVRGGVRYFVRAVPRRDPQFLPVLAPLQRARALGEPQHPPPQPLRGRRGALGTRVGTLGTQRRHLDELHAVLAAHRDDVEPVRGGDAEARRPARVFRRHRVHDPRHRVPRRVERDNLPRGRGRAEVRHARGRGGPRAEGVARFWFFRERRAARGARRERLEALKGG